MMPGPGPAARAAEEGLEGIFEMVHPGRPVAP